MTKVKQNTLRDYDPRLVPSYSAPEAAHYLRIPVTTLRAWAFGQKYKTSSGEGTFQPVITIPDKKTRLLSFINLVEIHVLDAIRREHNISLPKVRKALSFIENHFSIKNPLANEKFETDGIDLFIEKSGLINITKDGQMAIRSLLEAHLKRIEWDTRGIPIRLYPFTRKRELEEPKSVVIDPFVSFGRPILSGTGIATSIIAERYKAGESIDELADDYGRDRSEIEEAIRCELEAA
jgi:uncharacterized protein (DUF433 family)